MRKNCYFGKDFYQSNKSYHSFTAKKSHFASFISVVYYMFLDLANLFMYLTFSKFSSFLSILTPLLLPTPTILMLLGLIVLVN